MIRTRFDLDTSAIFLDVIFSKYNIYNVLFIYHGEDVDTVPVNILTLSKFHMSILQSCADDFCKVTFVSSLDLNTFGNMLRQLVHKVGKLNRCKIYYE